MKRSVRLDSVMKKVGITHKYVSYYLRKSPTHRVPGSLVFKLRRGGPWMVRPEDIPAVTSRLPAKTVAGRAFKTSTVQKMVQPELGLKCGGGCSCKPGGHLAFKARMTNVITRIKAVFSAEDSIYRDNIVSTLRKTAERLNGGNPTTRELVHTGLWHGCYVAFDDLYDKAELRKTAVARGEKMLDVIQRKGLIREFHDYVVRECARRIA